VVGAEMPSYWEGEALEAQAIASRTYCLYIRKRFGVNRAWDVKATQANQVYAGLSAETATVWEAVEKTTGQVLTYKKSGGGREIFPTYYSSTCGGHTENSKNVFGDSFEPLAGAKCPYCRKVAKMSFFFWPMAKFDAQKTSDALIKRYPKLKVLGKVTGIEAFKVSEYGRFGRVTSVKLTGENGKTQFLRGEDLRLTVDPTGGKIKSMNCNIIKLDGEFRFFAGRGYGHGVGMCQCGAEQMARDGKKAGAILSHYYPGSKQANIY